MSLPDTPFNVLMQQAAALKTAQLSIDRRNYDRCDIWYRNSLFSKDDIKNVRETRDYDQIMLFAEGIKALGNEFFKSGSYVEAIQQYERTLALFNWIEPTEEDWKSKPIEDKKLKHDSFIGSNENEQNSIKLLRKNCLLNLSACYLKIKEYSNCIKCCDFIINNLDEKCVKAFFRRGQARYLPLSSGTIENQMALKDLKIAYELKPDDNLVKNEYIELNTKLKNQQERDKKVFNNLFDRDKNMKIEEIEKTENKTENETENVNIGMNSLNLKDAKKLIEDMKKSAKQFIEDDEYENANQLNEKINELEFEINNYEDEIKEKNIIDFNNPTNEMIEEAKREGLDITDPRIKKIISGMNEAREKDESNNTDIGKVDDYFNQALQNLFKEQAIEVSNRILKDLKGKEIRKMLKCRFNYSFKFKDDQFDKLKDKNFDDLSLSSCKNFLRKSLILDITELLKYEREQNSNQENLTKELIKLIEEKYEEPKKSYFSYFWQTMIFTTIILALYLYSNNRFPEAQEEDEF